MLTRVRLKNFKRFAKADIELGDPVVFIGPNNSGKTSALQALALWSVGVRRWNQRRQGAAPSKRPGVTINRKDLISLPIPDANHLWKELHVRDVRRAAGKQNTSNVRVEIAVDGIDGSNSWSCGLEFDYANAESIYCRPLRDDDHPGGRMPVPPIADSVQVAFLPPMSGLTASETRLDKGAVDVRIGEGRTAEVLRNLCLRVAEEASENWERLVGQIHNLFGVTIEEPTYVVERGEIAMSYRQGATRLDLSSSGRGLQQTLLLLSYMYANPRSVLLLDEPDAHLEILRQRHIYEVLTQVSESNGNQIIAASHSEVLLNEAADRDVVVAFLGAPHRIDDRGSQVAKSLKEIGFEHYYQAEHMGWVLFLEGSSDLAILRAFAQVLQNERAVRALERPYVVYVGNQPTEVLRHYHGLREAVPKLRGIGVLDRIDRGLPPDAAGLIHCWRRREIENYFCYRETLEAYVRKEVAEIQFGPLFEAGESAARLASLNQAINEVENALATLGKGSPWSPDLKVSDDFLSPVFEKFFASLGIPNVMDKKNFHVLASVVPRSLIDREVADVLDAIVKASAG